MVGILCDNTFFVQMEKDTIKNIHIHKAYMCKTVLKKYRLCFTAITCITQNLLWIDDGSFTR